MAVGTAHLPKMPPIAGVRLGTACAGIKQPGRKDLVVLEIAEGSQVAAVFTRNAFCAGPVTLAREHLQQGAPSWLLINTGNANAGTGAQGYEDALTCCAGLGELAGSKVSSVLPFSTGVIGEPLPVATIVNALPAAHAALAANGWHDAAEGILTTDTRPKGATAVVEYQGKTIRINGIAKGAGMIQPNMATMLAFIATDAKIEQSLLQKLLGQSVQYSFNRVTVDGDTSTNDACVLIATGQSEAPEVTETEPELLSEFKTALDRVCTELAQAIIRDGEGATKFVTLEIKGGRTGEECLQVGYAIAHSPLVKTALFASDPNWGRILAVVGRAGLESLDVSAVNIFLGDVCIVERGGLAASYTEAQGQAVMDREEITVRVELGRGECSETVWTTDLSHDYVSINADYRT